MKDISEIRRINLNRIKCQFESQVNMSECLDMQPNQLNHLLKGFRNIGEKIARKIELKLKIPVAERLIKLAEAEVKHRQDLDVLAVNANIEAQSKQLAIEAAQYKAVFRSDLVGQIAGFIVCLACIAAAAYLGLYNHDWLAGGIAAIPTASLIKSFILKK